METVAIETPLACATSRNVTADPLVFRRRIFCTPLNQLNLDLGEISAHLYHNLPERSHHYGF
jgi:hypothetical protein